MQTQTAHVAAVQASDASRGASAAWMLAEPAPFAATGSTPLHIFRLGPIYDRTSGELIADITDDLLSELARVFPLQRADGQTVPLDWAHGSEMASTPEEAGPLGEVTALRHVPGQGMWAEVAWTARGVRVVSDGAPALYTSPAFDLSPVYSKRTGEQLGTAYLRSVALTDRPRQDRLDPVCLSEVTTPPAPGRKGAIAMADTATAAPAQPAGTLAPQPGAPAPAPAPAPVIDTSAEPADLPQALAIIAALREEAAMWKGKCEEMGMGVEMEADPKKPACAEPTADTAAAVQANAQLAETQRAKAGLEARLAEVTARLDRAEAERKAEKRSHRLDLAERAGHYAPSPERRAFFMSLSDAQLDQELARLAKHPEVDLSERGHGKPAPVETKTAAERLDEAVRAHCAAKGLDPRRAYNVALAEVKRVNPALYAAGTKGV